MNDQEQNFTTAVIGVGAAALLGLVGFTAWKSRDEGDIDALSSADRQEVLRELQRQDGLLRAVPSRRRTHLQQLDREIGALKSEGGLNTFACEVAPHTLDALFALGDANFAIGDVLASAAGVSPEYTVVAVRKGWVQLTSPGTAGWRNARWREVQRDARGLFSTDLDEQPIRKVSGLRQGSFTFSARRPSGVRL